MRRTRALPLLALPLAAALLAAPTTATGTPASSSDAAPALPSITASELEVLLDPVAEPGDPMLAMRGGTVPEGAFVRASAQAATLAAKTKGVDKQLASAPWELQGPTNIGGRVLDIVVDPTRPDSSYLAAASGGVWHSADAGMVWRSVWPDDLTQAVGALDISPTGVLWAGTGEAGPGGGSITYGGTGVYRSADGGTTWQNMGLTGSDRIGRVVVDPTDEDVVWVAANGPLYTRGGERGLYKTVDGGQTWEVVLAGANDTTGAVDVQLDPTDPNTVYATMWDRLREPDRRTYTGTGSGAFKSTDGGATWTRIGGPALASSPQLGRLGITVAPSDPDRVYILAPPEGSVPTALYRSDDGGATFVPVAGRPALNLNTAFSALYPWWFGRVYVDPANADRVFTTGVNLARTDDGGRTFSAIPGVHADQHGMDWDPKVPGRVYLGNDGGAYRSDDNAVTFEHGQYMPWNQPFSVAVSEQDPSKVLVGLQDNGGNRNYTDTSAPGPSGFNDITGGDGTEMTFDPNDDSIVFGCSQYGACARSTDGGERMSGFDDQVLGSRKNWLTPIEHDPLDPDTVYTASELVSMSSDKGETWRPISPDLTGGPGRETNPLFRSYGTITTLAVANAEFGTVYAGSDDGRVSYTHDGGLTWTRATGLPTDWVTSVAIDRRDPATHAFASFSGFRAGMQKALVFATTDGGKTWEDISGDLPQAPVNDVLSVGDDLVAATDVGVFVLRGVRAGGEPSWLKVGSGMPNAPITEVRWHAGTSTLFAANFGRGAYSVQLPGLGQTAEKPGRTARPLVSLAG